MPSEPLYNTITGVPNEPGTVTIEHLPQVRERDGVALLTPMDMLNKALSQNASIEVLERLMTLNERWEANQARKAFNAAMAEAKAKIPPIIRNATGHNDRKYADFSAITRVVDPILAEFGLTFRFRTVQTERINVTCILIHKGGHSEENTLGGPPDTSGSKNSIQAIGSTLTYLQRYSLMQALGLAATNDDDGNSGDNGIKQHGDTHNTTITTEQATTITQLAGEVKADIPKFITYMRVPSIAEMPANQYQRAIDALNAKRRAQQQ